MKYQTTNLQPTKRYPTYQFHARTAQKKLPAEQVFCICVLETLHWLRSRLKKFSSLPEDICTPEPAQYEAFSMQPVFSEKAVCRTGGGEFCRHAAAMCLLNRRQSVRVPIRQAD